MKIKPFIKMYGTTLGTMFGLGILVSTGIYYGLALPQREAEKRIEIERNFRSIPAVQELNKTYQTRMDSLRKIYESNLEHKVEGK
jgi:hypothetical protein